jgi:hypothetical protein
MTARNTRPGFSVNAAEHLLGAGFALTIDLT